MSEASGGGVGSLMVQRRIYNTPKKRTYKSGWTSSMPPVTWFTHAIYLRHFAYAFGNLVACGVELVKRVEKSVMELHL